MASVAAAGGMAAAARIGAARRHIAAAAAARASPFTFRPQQPPHHAAGASQGPTAPLRPTTPNARRGRGATTVAAAVQLQRLPVEVGKTARGNRSNLSSFECEEDCQTLWELAVADGYSATDNAAYWETRPVAVISRAVRIAGEVVRWRLLSSPVGQALFGSGGENAAPALLLDALIRLGPAFVKIGQALSSRPDVLPPAYLEELEKLQDRIPPFPTDVALRVMAQELGRDPSEVFTRITPEPVAAASLGQVYRARLVNGDEVAVKVQRPGVVTLIAMDVYILRYMAAAGRTIGKLNTDLPALVDEWATSLFKELDYNREGANAARFKELFQRMPEVYVPTVYSELTTTRVMTMEWIEGERLRTAGEQQAEGRTVKGSLDDLALVEVGVRCSLEQMLEEGFYHADPHPGNLLKMPDGRLAYLDFGMMGSIDLKVRQALVRATLHLVNKEFSYLAEDIVALGFLPGGSDRSAIVPALTGVFQAALAGGASNISFGQLSTSLGRTMYEFKFQVPSYYTLLVRSLSVLEGIALASDPNYKVLGAAYPWVARRLLTDSSPELQTSLRSLLYKDGGRFQFDRLQALLEQAAKVKALGSMRATPAASTASFAPAPPPPSAAQRGLVPGTGPRPPTVLPPAASPLQLLLSTDGTFVRDIVLDEVAKGVDAAWRLSFDSLGRNVGPPISTLLLALPRLSDREDEEQVEGLTNLATALYRIANTTDGAEGADAASNGSALGSLQLLPELLPALPLLPEGSVHAVRQAASFLQWLASELATLPPGERNTALYLPIDVASRVSGRVLARAIREALGPVSPSTA
ncbi:hypothetical protein FOA52_013219 [Chlamydomonas sp. UWO 241]|nr:hypothetical protein FOA52_013219 [Chlamydomonas sp. UWO 241]